MFTELWPHAGAVAVAGIRGAQSACPGVSLGSVYTLRVQFMPKSGESDGVGKGGGERQGDPSLCRAATLLTNAIWGK